MSKSPLTRKHRPLFPDTAQEYVLGVDGCPEGWVCVALPIQFTANNQLPFPVAVIYTNFNDLLKAHYDHTHCIMVDMPIGLLDIGRRPCEQMARKTLGNRRSSVFPAPRRPMLAFQHYEQANEWGKNQTKTHGPNAGGGLSKQAWNILPKIREIDASITAAHQTIIGEAHPELAFTRLNKGIPCQFNKKTSEGRQERSNLIQCNKLPHPQLLFDELKQNYKTKASIDDMFDAMALALTAQARLNGNALHCFDGTIDMRGLKVEIWG